MASRHMAILLAAAAQGCIITEPAPAPGAEAYRASVARALSYYEGSEKRYLISTPPHSVAMPQLSFALEPLFNGGASEEELSESILREAGPQELPNFFYCLEWLSSKGLLLQVFRSEKGPYLTFTSAQRGWYLPRDRIDFRCHFVLSRFAYLRRDESCRKLVIESGRSPFRIVLDDSRAVSIVANQPFSLLPDRACNVAPELGAEDRNLLIRLLFDRKFLVLTDPLGKTSESDDLTLCGWEFHDLLFHARTREGRHSYPAGATFHNAHRFFSPPASLEVKCSAPNILLNCPERNCGHGDKESIWRVMGSRRSIRQYGNSPISKTQLGDFLYTVARVRSVREDSVQVGGLRFNLELLDRAYPAGGAIHELVFGLFRRHERVHFPFGSRYGSEFLYCLGSAGT
jgi:hypothetical protein